MLTLVDRYLRVVQHFVPWDGRGKVGRSVGSGSERCGGRGGNTNLSGGMETFGGDGGDAGCGSEILGAPGTGGAGDTPAVDGQPCDDP